MCERYTNLQRDNYLRGVAKKNAIEESRCESDVNKINFMNWLFMDGGWCACFIVSLWTFLYPFYL